MKRTLGILAGLVGALAVLLVVAAVVLPLVFDEDDLKEAISSEVTEKTGRDMTLAGDLDFSVFPWLALEVNDISLGNAAGFDSRPFAHIGKARAGVALMPLLRRQISIDKVTLHGLELALAVDEQGRNNWDDLAGGGDAGAASEPGAGTFSTQRVAGLDIRDARVDFQDLKSDSHYLLSGLSLQTGALGEGAPVPVELRAVLEDVAAGMRADVELSATAVFDVKADRYALQDLDLALAASASGAQHPVRIRAPRLDLDLAAQTLLLVAFNAELAGLRLNGGLSMGRILDGPTFAGSVEAAEFSPAAWLQAMGVQPPVTADPQVLQEARFSARYSGSGSEIALTEIDLALDQSRFAGELSVRNFEQPKIGFELSVDEIDLDRYLEPAGGSGGTAAEEAVAMPREELRGQEIEGRLAAGRLRLAGVDFTAAEVGVSVRDGRLRLHPLTGEFYGGRYSGDIGLDGSAAVPVLSLDETIDSVAFRRLVADLVDSEAISGTAEGFARLTGEGRTSDEVLGSLHGDVGLTLTEGALEGINIWYEIRRGMALYKGVAPPEPEPDRTVFSRMQVSAGVDRGVVTTRELIGELPFLTLSGSGTVDLARSRVDLGMVAAVSSSPDLATDPLASELRGRSLPFRVTGTLDDPAISIDWKTLLAGEIADRLLDKLGLGSKAEAGDGGQEGQDGQENKSSGDQIIDSAKGSLLNILRGKEKKTGQDQDGN